MTKQISTMVADFLVRFGPELSQCRNLSLVIICLLSCTSVLGEEAAVPGGAGDDDAVIDALFAHWDQPGSPGCAVAVSDNGETIYSRGYGYANLDYGISITPKTVFDIASVTKQFIATSVSMLALDGELSFDDDVRKFLPELPEYDEPIRLRHMVYHTSGLRDYLTLFPLAGRDDYYPMSGQQILDMMARQRALIFPPGEREEYSNTAYMLLALVIERVTGRTLGDFIDERIYQPLQMVNSLMYDDLEQVIGNRAMGYARDGADIRITHVFNFDVPGDGQMYTTVGDLLRWNQHLHGKEKPAFYELLMEPAQLSDGTVLPYGKGLYFDEYRGMTLINHTGSSWGFRSALIHFAEADMDVAIICNDDNARPYDIALQIADHLLADQLAARVDSDEVASAPSAAAAINAVTPARKPTGTRLQEYDGTYFSPELDAIYRLAEVDGTLSLRIEQELAIPVYANDTDRFQFYFSPAGWNWTEIVELEFSRSTEGQVAGFLLSTGMQRGIVFEKVELPSTGDLN